MPKFSDLSDDELAEVERHFRDRLRVADDLAAEGLSEAWSHLWIPQRIGSVEGAAPDRPDESAVLSSVIETLLRFRQVLAGASMGPTTATSTYELLADDACVLPCPLLRTAGWCDDVIDIYVDRLPGVERMHGWLALRKHDTVGMESALKAVRISLQDRDASLENGGLHVDLTPGRLRAKFSLPASAVSLCLQVQLVDSISE